MKKNTRFAFNAYLQQLARLNGVAVEELSSKFTVEPSVQQTLEDQIQQSAAFLTLINVTPVTEQSGQLLGLGVGSTIAGTTDTTAKEREPVDPTLMVDVEYKCEQTNFDTVLTYAKLDLWAKFQDFQVRIRNAIVKRQALDRIMIGFNGVKRAKTSNRSENPLLQDVNKGWLQKIREDAPDIVNSTKKAKFNALCDEVERRHRYGQPILIGTIAVETSELVSRMLTSRGIRHNVLNAKNHAREAEIIMKAGVRGAVTIATNMAGRGTDIKLGPGVAELGGLAVLGSERHESRRIDNQLRGRSGRQGDPGYSRFYVSFEDDLMQRFGSERVKSMAGKLEDTPIEFKSVSKAIETAQKRVEGQNFDTRKQLLQYDDVMRQQREIMYVERDTIMTEPDLSEIVKTMFQLAIEKAVTSYTKQEGKENVIDVEGVMAYVAKNFMLFATLNAKNPSLVEKDPERLKQALLAVVFDQYRSRFRQDMTLEQRTEYEKNILLSVIDYAWINHIDAMSKLRTGIYLRAYAQKDPLAEYTEEGFYMFEAMNQQIAFDVSSRIIRMGLRDLNENVEEIVGHRNLDLDFR